MARIFGDAEDVLVGVPGLLEVRHQVEPRRLACCSASAIEMISTVGVDGPELDLDAPRGLDAPRELLRRR